MPSRAYSYSPTAATRPTPPDRTASGHVLLSAPRGGRVSRRARRGRVTVAGAAPGAATRGAPVTDPEATDADRQEQQQPATAPAPELADEVDALADDVPEAD